MTKNRYKESFLQISKFIMPYKKWYILASLISLLLVGTELLNAKLTQTLIDTSYSGDISAIIFSILTLIIIIFANIILNYISGVAVSKFSANSSRDLKRHISKLLLNAKYVEIIKLKSGDVLSTVNADTNVICGFIAGFELLTYIIGPTVYIPFMLNGLNQTIASINRIKQLEDIPQNEKAIG